MSFAALEPNCPGAENVPFVVRLVADWLAGTVYDVPGMPEWCKNMRTGPVTSELATSMSYRFPHHVAANVNLMRSMSLCCRFLWHALRTGAIETWRATRASDGKVGHMSISRMGPTLMGLEHIRSDDVLAVARALQWKSETFCDWVIGGPYPQVRMYPLHTTTNTLEQKVLLATKYFPGVEWSVIRIDTPYDGTLHVNVFQLSPLQLLEFERALVANGFTIVSGFCRQ